MSDRFKYWLPSIMVSMFGVCLFVAIGFWIDSRPEPEQSGISTTNYCRVISQCMSKSKGNKPVQPASPIVEAIGWTIVFGCLYLGAHLFISGLRMPVGYFETIGFGYQHGGQKWFLHFVFPTAIYIGFAIGMIKVY